MGSSKPLSEKERRFVDAYVGEAAGNATEAARIAGYKNPNKLGPRQLVKVGIRAAIDALSAKRERATIADAAERDEIASAILRDPEMHPLARLKAMSELNKVEGRHITKHEISGKLTLEQVLDASRSDGARA